MPTNGMNTGQDYSLFYYDGASGALVDLGDVQSVSIRAMKHTVSSKPYNKPSRYGYVPDGYELKFAITRTGPEIVDFMVQAEANFNNGAVSKPGYLQETVLNDDGSFSRYQYTEMVIFLDDHGEISKDKVVTLSLEGYASRKIQIA